MKFVAYNDKSSARRGFSRAFKDAVDPDSYLAQQESKWGFYKQDDGSAYLPTGDEITKEHEPRGSAGYKDKRVADEKSVPVDVGVLNEMRKAMTQVGVDPANAEALFSSASVQGALARSQSLADDAEDEDDAPRSSAFANFAMAQLTGRPAVVEPVLTTPDAPLPAARVERNREEQNGVKRPSAGTICAQIWDLAASLSELSESAVTSQGHSKVATLGEVTKAAEARGINKYTARTQYARWRVFNGILGRLTA